MIHSPVSYPLDDKYIYIYISYLHTIYEHTLRYIIECRESGSEKESEWRDRQENRIYNIEEDLDRKRELE